MAWSARSVHARASRAHASLASATAGSGSSSAGNGPDLGDSLRAGAASLVDVATRVLVAHVVGRRPEVDAAPLQIAAEAFARLVVSHVMAPDRDIDAAADAISAVLSPYLRTLLASAEPE
ncbi:hypothetical protein [Pseudonocardia sp. WMMC193]|uniref:hypothetical protein n=1 Tax=Pseudonocardia sp. WMMC193 TaxID=2911965 RepID=UPI0035AB6FFE